MTSQLLVARILPKNIVIALKKSDFDSKVFTCIYNEWQRLHHIILFGCLPIVCLIKTLHITKYYFNY